MINVHIEKLTWDTVDDVLKLKVSKEQKEFVATNRDSMIDAYFALTEEKIPVYTFGIYLGKKPVGFLMIGYDVPMGRAVLRSAEGLLLHLAFYDR